MPSSNQIAITPAVQSLQQGEGCNNFPRRPTIGSDSDCFAVAADALAQALKVEHAVESVILQNGSEIADVRFETCATTDLSAYRLAISNAGILIQASDSEGAFYAVQSLRQIFAQTLGSNTRALPELLIEDSPNYAYRGMHLDVSRHFFDVDFIKRYIDLIALHKMNFFHWHLTDDSGWRIESKHYPRLTDVGASRSGTVQGFTLDPQATSDGVPYSGYYTQDEVREVIAYAAKRHITVVPEIDIPGHASALLAAYPELTCHHASVEVEPYFGIFENVICNREASFEFLGNVLSEIASLFPGPYIHIGGDEVRTTQWEQCSDCLEKMRVQGLEQPRELQRYFVNRVVDIVLALGKQPIAWDDVVAPGVDPNVTVMAWLSRKRAHEAAANGQDIIMTPVQHAYFDFYQSHSLDEPMAIHGLTRLSDVYDFNPREGIESDYQSRVVGGQGNLWTEYITTPEAAERMILPRMSGLAEKLWSDPLSCSWPDFSDRLVPFESFLKTLGYSVADSHYKPHIVAERRATGVFCVSIEALGKQVVYTVDGSSPTVNSETYKVPLILKGSQTVRASTLLDDGSLLGDSRLSLCDHLGLAAEVSVRHSNSEVAERAARLICNGQRAFDRLFDYPYWIALTGEDLDVTFAFERLTEVSSVGFGFDVIAHRRLYPPCGARVLAWDTGGNWSELLYADSDTIRTADRDITLNFTPTWTTQLRVVIENQEQVWSVETKAMVPKTIYIDEVVIQ